MDFPSGVNGWRKVRSNIFGNNISVIYKKGFFTLEFFKDSYWGKTDNMNIIVRDSRIKSLMSRYGRDVHVEYLGSHSEAVKFATDWMRKH